MGERFSSRPIVAPPDDPLAGERLVYSNEWGDGFRYRPERLRVELRAPLARRRFPGVERVRLVPPAGWRVEGAVERALGEGATLDWTVTPGGPPGSCRQAFACEVFAGGRRVGRVEHVVRLEMRGRSQFDPRRHALPFRNAVADLGPVEPRREVFARTYRADGVVLPGAFFRGLYRDIVFLTAATDARGSGGLCTGMARVALERSLEEGGGVGAEDKPGTLRERVELWHGRQLTDGALRAAAWWFFRGSPAAALAEFRAQLFATGRSAVAFDIGVARWAPSPRLPARLVRHGHTVVPYAFRQNEDAALVFVYDPSHPAPEDLSHNAIRFDLRRDRYAYRGFGSLTEDDGTTIIAAGQGAFRAPGTAFLASLASLALYPGTLIEAVRRSPAARRVAPLAVAGLLGGLALARGGRRGV